MISSAHVIIYRNDAHADRAFFPDVLQLPAVDAGRGWLIFALPPAELAMHPAEGNASHELFLMCPDLKAVLSRSEEHTSELQSHSDLVCRLLLEKKKKNDINKCNH